MMKNKKYFRGFSIILILLALFAGSFFTVQKVAALDDINNKLQVFIQVLEYVKSDYVEKKVDDSKLVYGAIKGMIESLDDPYTRFLEPTPFKEMKMRMNGTYFGIGIYIGMRAKTITVIAPIPDTPAFKAGLLPGDQIVSIDGKETKNMALEEAVSHIRGPKGTTVKIGILRRDEKKPKEYTLLRDKIVVKNIEKKILSDSIGYIKLNSFENLDASKEMRKTINDMKKSNIKGLIIDLRNNGGGLLSNAVEVASMFLKKDAVIVMTLDRDGQKEIIRSSGELIWNGPLAVLINEGSASASEILAGAIKDNDTGTLVGFKSFGKASVQSVRQLSDGSAILLTIAKYQTPNGRDISKKGISPDIEVKTGKENVPYDSLSTEEVRTILKAEPDEKNDIQLKKAMEVLESKIEEAK